VRHKPKCDPENANTNRKVCEARSPVTRPAAALP